MRGVPRVPRRLSDVEMDDTVMSDPTPDWTPDSKDVLPRGVACDLDDDSEPDRCDDPDPRAAEVAVQTAEMLDVSSVAMTPHTDPDDRVRVPEGVDDPARDRYRKRHPLDRRHRE